MNKFKAFAASAVLAAATIAAPGVASAATIASQSSFYTASASTGFYAASVIGTGSFTAPFSFDVGPLAGTAGLSISAVSISTATAIDNLVLTLNGINYAITDVSSTVGGGQTFVYKTGGISQNVAAGLQNLVISGNVPVGAAGGSFSGTIDFTASAVPEPASWGLMIVGFGAAGVSLRRRSAQTAKLKLA